LVERSEKNGMTEEAHRIIKVIRQMEASLEDNKNAETYPEEDQELRVYAPLTRCLKSLKEKHNSVSRAHRERFEQVKSEWPIDLMHNR
jgi:protein regulator of cytokinesis 1